MRIRFVLASRRLALARLALTFSTAAVLVPSFASAQEEFYSRNYASSGLLSEDNGGGTPTFDASLSAEQAAAEKLLYSPSTKEPSTPPAPTLPSFRGYEGRFTKRQAGVESRTVPHYQSTIVVDR